MNYFLILKNPNLDKVLRRKLLVLLDIEQYFYSWEHLVYTFDAEDHLLCSLLVCKAITEKNYRKFLVIIKALMRFGPECSLGINILNNNIYKSNIVKHYPFDVQDIDKFYGAYSNRVNIFNNIHDWYDNKIDMY